MSKDWKKNLKNYWLDRNKLREESKDEKKINPAVANKLKGIMDFLLKRAQKP